MTKQEQAKVQAEVEALREECAKLKAAKGNGGRLSLKVSQKGAVSVYGMGRFPVTLYGQQWEKLAEFLPEIRKFITANKSSLSVKA